jgi:hypothetical protein
MAAAFALARAEGGQRVVLVGTDCPGLSRELLEEALSAMGVDRALRKVSGELSSQYRLSYDATQKDAKLEVQVARPGAKVRVGPASSSARTGAANPSPY